MPSVKPLLPFNNGTVLKLGGMRCFLTLLALCLSAVCCLSSAYASGDCIEGNNVTENSIRKLAPFTSLAIDGIFDVIVTCGQPYDIKISADSNILPHVLTTVDNGKLTISTARSICTKNPVSIKISAPSLKFLFVDGSCDVSITRIDNDTFDSRTDGSATVRLQGKTGKLTLKVEGSATVEAAGLEAKEVHAETYDSSDAEIQATKSLDAECHDSSDLKFSGAPTTKNLQTFDACDLTPM